MDEEIDGTDGLDPDLEDDEIECDECQGRGFLRIEGLSIECSECGGDGIL